MKVDLLKDSLISDRNMSRLLAALVTMLSLIDPAADASAQRVHSHPIRAMIPRASTAMVIDGKLNEYAESLCTPVEYFHPDVRNRAAQLFYLWDDEAFYVAVRTLDETPFTPEDHFWVGDAVEFYCDARRGGDFLTGGWKPGGIHCFFAGVRGARVEPRFQVRPGFEEAMAGEGVQVASHRSSFGLEVEFKLPWMNLPGFRAEAGAVVGLDAELSYSDGVSRSYRTFAFGGPLSVEQPANLAAVQLVDSLARKHWEAAGPVMMPIRIDIPWQQEGPPQVVAQIAIPPHHRSLIGNVRFDLYDTRGRVHDSCIANEEDVFHEEGQFVRRIARWPAAIAPAGRYSPVAVVFDADGVELTRVTPRLNSVNMDQGY